MTELSSATVAPQRSGWVMWLIWVVATCAGIVTVLLLSTAFDPLSAAFVPPESPVWLLSISFSLLAPALLLVTGAAQHFALGGILPGERSWFRRTLSGVVVGIPVGLVLGILGTIPGIGDMRGLDDMDFWGKAFNALGIGCLTGIVMLTAVLQKRALQRYSRRAGWWLLASLLGWGVGASVIVAWTAFSASGRMFKGVIAEFVAASVLMGLLVGAVTGAALVFILRAGPAKVVQNNKLPAVADVNDASGGI